MEYQPRDFTYLLGMRGFSKVLLENHFTLYKGYVTNTNRLLETASRLLQEGKTGTPEYSEVKRRLGFEFNGMRLHEYYFENLGGKGVLNPSDRLASQIVDVFGSYPKWEEDFKATAKMRGIGWVILYRDGISGKLFNQWINEHEVGHPAGCNPILVIDVFEHAYLTDYGLNRVDYIEAFFQNINWDNVASRLT